MKKLIISFAMFLLIAPMLSSCALLDKLRGGVSPHADVFIEVPVVDNVEDIVVPTVDADDIRG